VKPATLKPFHSRSIFALAALFALVTSVANAAIDALLAERAKAVVAVEYVTQTEAESHSNIVMGTVIDANGTIVLQPNAVDTRVPITQLRDFRVRVPGQSESHSAQYLGQDAFTGWHFIRASEEVRAQLRPIGDFVAKDAPATPIAENVWGIGLRNKDEDFLPYVLQSHIAMITAVPGRTAITQQEVAAPGLPVFNADGAFLGLAINSYGQSYLQLTRGAPPQPVTLVNVEESSAFTMAEEILPYLSHVPKSPSGRPIASLGIFDLEPIDHDAAKFLALGGQSGVVIGYVAEGGSAAAIGLRTGDILLAIDKKPIPVLRPISTVPAYVEREITRHQPGDHLALTVLRGAERLTLDAVLGEAPKLVREAERKVFERLGLVVREVVLADAAARRDNTSGTTGAVVCYVRPDSLAATAGLREDDVIRGIDGKNLGPFNEAVQRLVAIDKTTTPLDAILRVWRDGGFVLLRLSVK